VLDILGQFFGYEHVSIKKKNSQTERLPICVKMLPTFSPVLADCVLSYVISCYPIQLWANRFEENAAVVASIGLSLVLAHLSLGFQVHLITSQTDHNICAALPLQFLDPSFCSLQSNGLEKYGDNKNDTLKQHGTWKDSWAVISYTTSA
jgi:hypothetical protein